MSWWKSTGAGLRRLTGGASTTEAPRYLIFDLEDVATQQRALGQDGEGGVRFRQGTNDPAHQLVAALGPLVWIGVRAQIYRLAHVTLRSKIAVEQPSEPGLVEDPRLEIQPRSQVPVGMGGPREAVDAAVLATLVRVD